MSRQRSSPFAIYGAGGFGREVAWLARSDPTARYAPRCFVDDAAGDDDERRLDELPVLSPARYAERHREVPLVVAVGRPDTKRSIVERLAPLGLRFTTLVHDSVRLAPSVKLGEGAIVCAGCIPTVDIRIGTHAHVNLDCTIGHNVTIGDFATLSPGVHVSGFVTIGTGAFVGTGVTIVNGRPDKPLSIGEGSAVGAGACVTGDIEPRTLCVGVPAKVVRRLG